MKIIEVKGDTFCIETGLSYIPFYKINDEEIIMLDTGWAKGEREGYVEYLYETGKLELIIENGFVKYHPWSGKFTTFKKHS